MQGDKITRQKRERNKRNSFRNDSDTGNKGIST